MLVRPPSFSLVGEELDGYVGREEMLDPEPPPATLVSDETGRKLYVRSGGRGGRL